MIDLGSFFGMIDQIARSSGAVNIARNVHVDVPYAKTLQPPAGSPPPIWTLDEATAASERAAVPAGPRLVGLRPPDGALSGRSTIGTTPPSQLAALALGSLLADEPESGSASMGTTAAPTAANAAIGAAARNAALISALTGAMAMIDREIAAAEAEAARQDGAVAAGSSAADRSAGTAGAAAAGGSTAREALRAAEGRFDAGSRATAGPDDRARSEAIPAAAAFTSDAEAARRAGSTVLADRLASHVIGAIVAGGGAAGIMESAILNAAMIPGYPRPRPLVGVELEQARAAAPALAPDPAADPLDEARITAFLAILGLPEAMMARIRALLADDERRKGFLLTLMRMLKMVKLVLGSVREELEKIAEDLEEELSRHGERTPQGRHRLTL